MEDGITGRQRGGPRRPVDADGRERAVSAHPDAPRVEEHAGQVADVVGVKMGEEHGLQTGEVQPRGGER